MNLDKQVSTLTGTIIIALFAIIAGVVIINAIK